MKVKFGLKQSRLLACLLTVAAVSPIIGMMAIIPIPLPVRIALCAGILFVFVAAIRRYALLRGSRAVLSVSFLQGGGMEVACRDGVWRGNLTAVRLSPVLSVFVVQCGGRTFNVIVAPDSMDSNSNRQLRVQLNDEKRGIEFVRGVA